MRKAYALIVVSLFDATMPVYSGATLKAWVTLDVRDSVRYARSSLSQPKMKEPRAAGR